MNLTELIRVREIYKNWTIEDILMAIALCIPPIGIILFKLSDKGYYKEANKYYWQTEHL